MGNPNGSGGDARPNGMTSQDVRQFRNQASQMANDLQNLRRQLQGAGADPKNLQSIDEVVKGLRTLDNDRAYADTKGLQTEAQALDTLKKVEYDMRRKLDTSNQQLFLSGSDEVPPKYKDLVDQYYRALSKKAGGGGGGGK
jgi:outer membrane protein OmpA-like peptidoglycan-associated protein